MAGPYRPTVPRTGEDSAGSFRMGNLIVRGRNRYYWETFSGLGDLSESLTLVPLTGTIAFTADSTTVTGTATAFYSEVHLGQKICAIPTDNSNSWLLVPKRIISDTEMEVWRAPDSTASGVTGWRMARLNADEVQRQTCLTGNGLGLDKGHYVGAGSGVVRTDGTAFNASWTLGRIPSLNLFDSTAGTYTNFPLGMDTPTAPTLAAVAGGTKDMQAGSYSLVITPARKQTGGYNNPSLRADVTIANSDKIRITFPAMDTANGQNSWKVWVTPFLATLGADLRYLEGPWFYYIEVTDDDVNPAGGTFDIEYYDAEILNNELVSFNNDPPTDAEWMASLNNIPVSISCQGQGATTEPDQTSPGPFICPAKPTNVEAFPLELSFSTSPPETILWVLAAQGRLYLLTFNHLQIAQATPDPVVPILIRPYWKDGFAGPDQLVFVNGDLYGFTTGGPARSVGEGDESEAQRDWAADVYEITQPWSPGHVLVGYDPYNNAIVFFYSAYRRNTSGFWTTRWLMYGLSQDFWIGDGEFTSPTRDLIVCGVATIGDRLELLAGGRIG